MIRAFVFDLDGTLIQTERLKAQSYAKAIADMCPGGVDEQAALDAYAEVVGQARYEVAQHLVEKFALAHAAAARFEELGVDTAWQALIQLRMGYYKQMTDDPRQLRQLTWPHNIALLDYVTKVGCKIALATMSSKKRVEEVLSVLGLSDAFDFIATGDDVSHGKPDPEIYLLVADALGFAPSEHLVIEDSPSGIQSAVMAGMHCIAVTTEFSRIAVRRQSLLPSALIVDNPRNLIHAVMSVYDAERSQPSAPAYVPERAIESRGPFLPVHGGLLPWIEIARIRRADEIGPARFDISVMQMMELAGAAVADVLAAFAPPGGVVVLVGKGNNGAVGLCAARHIAARGRFVEVVLVGDESTEYGQHHLTTLKAMGIEPRTEPHESTIVVDALVGYGLHGSLTGRTRALADWARSRWTLAVDVPSGLGEEGAVRADVTVTLGLPKRGLESVERLFLADIGLPEQLWKSIDAEVGLPFARGRILEIVGRDELIDFVGGGAR